MARWNVFRTLSATLLAVLTVISGTSADFTGGEIQLLKVSTKPSRTLLQDSPDLCTIPGGTVIDAPPVNPVVCVWCYWGYRLTKPYPNGGCITRDGYWRSTCPSNTTAPPPNPSDGVCIARRCTPVSDTLRITSPAPVVAVPTTTIGSSGPTFEPAIATSVRTLLFPPAAIPVKSSSRSTGRRMLGGSSVRAAIACPKGEVLAGPGRTDPSKHLPCLDTSPLAPGPAATGKNVRVLLGTTPSPPPSPSASPARLPNCCPTYTIVKGDTLHSIGLANEVSSLTITTYNRQVANLTLTPGQRIALPCPRVLLFFNKLQTLPSSALIALQKLG